MPFAPRRRWLTNTTPALLLFSVVAAIPRALKLQAPSGANALSGGTEVQPKVTHRRAFRPAAGSRETLVHSFEKVHARGIQGRQSKRIDGDDELAAAR